MSRRSTTWTITLLCLAGVAWAGHSLDLLAVLRGLHGH